MKSIIFIAPPAAGKGTQSKMISSKYNIPHISTGDILRAAIENNDDRGAYIKKEIASGKLVSDSVILELLKERIQKEDCKHGYILDGFPRNINQAKEYEEILKEINRDLGIVILLELDKEIAKKRIVGRLSCKSCGAVYNTFYEEAKPKKQNICDNCHIGLTKREDDSETIFDSRYETYQKETAPLIAYYEKKGCLYRVDSGISKEYTFQQIEKIIGSSL